MFGGRSCQCRQNPQFLFPIPPHLNPRPHPSCRDWRTLHPAPPLSLSKFSDLVSRSADAIPSAANLEATFPAHSPHHLSRRANLQRRQTRGFHPLNIRRPVRITASTCLHRRGPVRVAVSTSR